MARDFDRDFGDYPDLCQFIVRYCGGSAAETLELLRQELPATTAERVQMIQALLEESDQRLQGLEAAVTRLRSRDPAAAAAVETFLTASLPALGVAADPSTEIKDPSVAADPSQDDPRDRKT